MIILKSLFFRRVVQQLPLLAEAFKIEIILSYFHFCQNSPCLLLLN